MIGSLARRSAKAAVLPAGLVSRRRDGDVVILLYHRIGDDPAEIELSVGAFERQLRTLSASNEVRTLDEALGGSGGVVVTFDDGTRDFHELALPLLVRYRIPALLYLATGMVDGGGDAGSLTWGHLSEAVGTGLVTIGSHTHGHADLSKADHAESAGQMKRSKDLIEDRLGVGCTHFAYPWAVASAPAERAARELFATAALDAWRTNRRGRIDRYRLGRVPVLRSDGRMFFRAKAAGRLDAERVVYRAFGRGPWRPR